MSEPTYGAAGFAIIKFYGIKALLGMVGAAILYMALPPKNPDGSFNEREFVFRLIIAATFSLFFGDWVADIMNNFLPWLNPYKHQKTVDLLTGAPGWWISRAAALWLYNRRGKDIGEVAQEVKGQL